LHVPQKMMWNWFRGLNDRPVLQVAEEGTVFISFIGLTEAHVLSSMRVQHGVSLPKIRQALQYLKIKYRSDHPLVEFEFQTNGIDLFVEEVGSLTNVSRYGQIGMRDILRLYLSRIERDDVGLPVRLYPFTQNKVETDPRIIVIDPSIAFGRPMIRRTGVRTAAVTERFKSGESVASLADDFGTAPAEIEAAIRSELDVQLAA